MSEVISLQQILQFSGTVEKAQMALQAQAGDQARAFDRELEKEAGKKADQTQATEATEEAKIREEDQRKKQHYAHRVQTRSDEEEKEDSGPSAEADQGKLINVVA